ncbi:MAG: hypothetical protein COA96_02755 [SAR86 cluster bacterium]|uniref:DUF2066 domain-containing protein n=1 Tax=SAR86 cluster bacterium TaxID=2030880 RepID=A0A2A5B889_9GAMM|nr:MAG: hypothetical protein COA96_02755 [SAR86 cluster bacterium]
MISLNQFYSFKALALTGVLFIVFFVQLQPSSALPMSGLYSQKITVTNENDSERSRAFTDALAAVIVKVTGERQWLETPSIERAIANAQSYVEGFSYGSEQIELPIENNLLDEDSDGGAFYTVDQRYITVNFASALIDELLADADIPVWDSNRPSVLVWMVLQNTAGERSFLTADARPDIVAIIQDFAEERGLPIIFPVLDFEDRRNLSENTVWNLDEEAISLASQRYGADSILSGRLFFADSGELVGVWQFIFQGEPDIFDGVYTDLESYLYSPLDRITNQLASHFAIDPESSNQQRVKLTVEGIKNLSAYSSLLSYVQNLALVNSVTTAELDGDHIELYLGLLGDGQQLFEQISLDRDLLPIESSQLFLHYRWTR